MLPQATVMDLVDGILFTPDGPVRAGGFIITGQPNVIVRANFQQVATLTSLALIPAGAIGVVVTASSSVFSNFLGNATTTDLVLAPNYIGQIVTGQPTVITRR